MRPHDLHARHAAAHAPHPARSPANAYYDRSAIVSLTGGVADKHVLELGSAAGALSEQLVDRGARPLGLDASERMVELARQRLGQRARFEVADLDEPLTSMPDDCVDLVVASLVLHYLEDRVPLLGELRRCLVPGGRLVFSVHHPAADLRLFDPEDYLRPEEVEDVWDVGGEQLAVSSYRRPLSAIFGQLARAAFTVAEPWPLPELAEVDPQAFEALSTQPAFLFIRAGV